MPTSARFAWEDRKVGGGDQRGRAFPTGVGVVCFLEAEVSRRIEGSTVAFLIIFGGV
jgi:hypothetical protein